jgi:UDP-glucose 4-epimerase
MRVVITGGAGFIGSNLAERLTADGMEVVALDDLSTGDERNLDGLGVELVIGSILDEHVLDKTFAGADCIVHFAARGSVPKSVADPVATHERNNTGTLMVLEAARRAGNLHTVVASSSSVYGAVPDLPKHEDLATRPMSPYAVSKLATEWYALAYQHSYGLPTMVFRFFNVYGPRQPAGHAYAAVIPAWIAAALAGEPVVVYGDGLQSRDFTYVDSVTSVVTSAITRRAVDPIPVNLAFGGGSTLLELADLLAKEIGTPVEVQHAEPRKGDIRHSSADPTRLRTLFPDAEPTSLEDGLARTVAWWRR